MFLHKSENIIFAEKERSENVLKQKEIEKIVEKVMKMYAEEHDGTRGWTTTAFKKKIIQAGGNEEDLLEAMAVGMKRCGVPGYRIR